MKCWSKRSSEWWSCKYEWQVTRKLYGRFWLFNASSLSRPCLPILCSKPPHSWVLSITDLVGFHLNLHSHVIIPGIYNPGHGPGLKTHWTCLHLFPESFSPSSAIVTTSLCCPHPCFPLPPTPQSLGELNHSHRGSITWEIRVTSLLVGLPAMVPSKAFLWASSRPLPQEVQLTLLERMTCPGMFILIP